MNTAQPLRRTTDARPLPSAKGQPHESPPAPHIFLPSENQPSRDLKALFDFKRRPGYYNAAAKVALLRRSKTAPHDELLVDFSGCEVQIELTAGGVLLASGAWTWQASSASEVLISQGAWSEVCWRREDECDYLEIEMPLSHGWKLQRQILLARQDRFLLLADALIGPVADPVEIYYGHALPLAADATLDPQRETRDGHVVVSGRRRASLVPPALVEWRSEFCHAELAEISVSLTLRQAALGHNLYAPLWLDLDPRRLRRPLTWRRLTVAENLAVVPRDVAAAYRIQAGRDQWVIYRSLAPPKNRSVLGYNTLSSFVCLRVLAGAKTEEILEIE
jgi:hypothetical protein